MAITFASCDEQYKKFPQLNRDEVLKLQDWYQKQPHAPKVTGKFNFFFFNFYRDMEIKWASKWTQTLKIKNFINIYRKRRKKTK